MIIMKKSILISLPWLFLTACSSLNRPTIYHDLEIDNKISNEINDLDMKIFRMFKENNYYDYSSLVSKTLAHQLNQHSSDEMLRAIAYDFTGKSFMVFDDFYSESLLPGNTILVHADHGDNSYSFQIKSNYPKTYISILNIADQDHSKLLVLLYAREDNAWKLAAFQVGNFELGRKTAFDLYKMARRSAAEKDTFNAFMYMNACMEIIKPCGEFISYDNEGEMLSFCSTLKPWITRELPMPMTLNEIDTKPEILKMYRDSYMDTAHITIDYKSAIAQDNTGELDKECVAIRKQLIEQVPAMEKCDRILFRAYENTPPPGTEVSARHHNFFYRKP